MSRPFRFAVQAVKTRSAAEWRDFSREAEALGYSTLFLADHYLGKGPAMDRQPQPLQYVGPIAAMTAAAMSTTTLRVGCRVFCVDYHVPAALVKEAVSIDLLSDGRLEFGIGAGWNPIEYAALGLDFREPPARVRKLREVVAIFKAHANVAFFHGAELSDPAGLLEGTGKRMRHVKLKPGQPVNSAALAELIDAAYLHIKLLLRAE